MPQELPTPTILTIAKICEPLSANDIAKNNAFNGGNLTQDINLTIFMVEQNISYLYGLNPNAATYQPAANYLFSLLGKYALQAQQRLSNIPPTLSITNPSPQTVNVGATATFSVTVTSTQSYTIQWYLNGVIIVGATGLSYSVVNAQLSQSGGLYSATATATTGSVSSNQGLLTVNPPTPQVSWWYGASDPYPLLSIGVDNLAYEITETITHNAPIVITYPTAAENNQYTVLKFPVGESAKTIWFNTSLNNGQIPDAIMRAIFVIGSFQYVVSRVAMSLDSTGTTLTYS